MIKAKEDLYMKKMSKHQIVSLLKETEVVIPIKKLCRKYAIGNSTFYNGQRNYKPLNALL